jgi:hypothetical protein
VAHIVTLPRSEIRRRAYVYFTARHFFLSETENYCNIEMKEQVFCMNVRIKISEHLFRTHANNAKNKIPEDKFEQKMAKS